MSNQKDYYEVLGVPRTATDEEIKKAYKKLIKQYHPDLNPDSKTAEEKMKEVNQAYEVLSDTEKRARFDQFGADGVDGNGFGGAGGFGGGQGAGDFGDIFDMFFGGGGAQGGGKRQGGPRQGNDLRLDLTIEFIDAAKGVQKDVDVTRLENCDSCHGSGAKAGTSRAKCPVCGGSGSTRVNQRTPFGQFQTVKTCTRCNGEGTIVEDPCSNCGGTGRVRKTRNISVNVPAGVDTGSRLRMSGEGEGGLQGGPAGDLYVYINVRPHAVFTREGDDIFCDLNVDMVQAALGCEIDVPTLEGKVTLSIPDGTQSGTSFRLRGRGFPRLRGYGKGDQHVKVRVQTPNKLTGEQKDLLRKFAALSKEDGDNTKESKGFFNRNKK